MYDVEHMEQIYKYVYSTPAHSPERISRLAELSEEDSKALFDYDMGLLSGRIKKPAVQNKESEDKAMNAVKEIKNYEDFKTLWNKLDYHSLRVLHQRDPKLYESYKEQLEMERLKKSDPYTYERMKRGVC